MNTTKKTNHRSHIITLILTLMLLAWGNTAWAEEVTATWNFRTMGEGTVNIQNKHGLVYSDVQGIILGVDATTGALKSRPSDAQINAGTSLQIPVVSTNDKVTVEAYNSTYASRVKINGVAMSAATETRDVSSVEVNQGFVNLTIEGGESYLFKISVEQNTTYPFTSTWDFKQSPYPSFTTEGFKSCLFANSGSLKLPLEVDATSGKLANNGDWAQFNAGTIIKVPVASVSDVVTVNTYSKNVFSVGGTTNADGTTITHNPTKAQVLAGYVEITASADDYLGSISVTQQEKQVFSDPLLGISVNAIDLYTASYETSRSANVTLTGSNLTDGTYQVTQPSVTGLTITPTQFTVTGGSVNQTFTISYTSDATVASNTADFTFATSDADKSVTVTATYGKTAKRGKSPVSVSEETTWDFNGAATQNITLSNSTNPTSNEEFIYTTLGEVKESVVFDAMTVKGQYAYYQGTCQVNQLKFTTTVAGTVTVTFNAGTTSRTSELYVNGNATGATSGNYDDVVKSVDVSAGDVILTGMTGGNATQLRFKKVVFTPSAPTPSEYDAIVTNVTELKAALAAASGTSEYKIFVQNGTYDLGTEINTQVKNYTTLIGESRDGVIIKNQPTAEGLGSSATLKIGSNVTLKDITLKCRAPYTGSAERGVCLWDVGTGNSYENICIDGLQDAYYSNGANGMTNTFTDCIIRGTVDFICGSGNITFNNCTLEVVKSHNGSKSIIAAPATYTEETGYVFNNCTIKASEAAIDCTVLARAASDHATGTVTDGGYYLARGWYAGNSNGDDRTPRTTFDNTTYSITPDPAKWTKMNNGDPDRAVFTEVADTPEPEPTEFPERTATWDFQHMAKGAVNIGDTGGTVDSDIAGVVLTVPAATGAKLNTRGGDAQFNKGTTIQVPVRQAGDIVTVVSYPGYHNYTVGGTAADADNTEYTATAADVTAGHVDIVATAESYLYSISVKQIAYSLKPTLADVTESTTWDWAKTGETTIQLTDDTTPSKTEEFILSDKIASTSDFKSDALKVIAEYPVRDGKYFQGGKITFHTTVPGKIKVWFSNTGNRQNQDKTAEDESKRRYLYVNGEKTQWGSCMSNANDKVTDYINVPAGDVVLTSKIDGNDADQYLRIYMVEFSDNIYPITAKWDFTKSGWATGNSNELKANEGTPLVMPIINTVRDNGNSIQCNVGTVFKVPVVSTSDVITIKNYGEDQYNLHYTIGDDATEYSDNEKNISPSTSEVENHYVLITCKNQGYVKSIQVVQQDPNLEPEPEPEPTKLSFKIDFTQTWAAEKINPKGAASTWYVTANTDDGIPTLSSSQPAKGNWMKFVGYYNSSTYGLYYKAHIYVPVKAGRYTVSLGKSDKGGEVLVTDGSKKLTTINTKESATRSSLASETFDVASDCTLDIYSTENDNICYPYFAIQEEEPLSYTDKILYKTKFQDWDAVEASAETTQVTKKTKDDQDLTFSLVQTAINPNGTDTKFTNDCITRGFMRAEKSADVSVVTSALNSVYKVKFVHAATGTNRGWGLKVKGDGDADWVTISDTKAVQAGSVVEAEVNRTNVQLMFYNLTNNQYAFMTSLEILDRVEAAPREFTNFKIDFRTATPTIVLPADGNLPSGVVVNQGGYHGDQHGATNTTITVPVDGPVKFTIGGCEYTNEATVKIDEGEPIAIDNKSPGCDGRGVGSYNKYATYIYNSMTPATLTFNLGSYCPYFFAEACEFIPDVNITYFDTDGVTSLGSQTVSGNSPLAYGYETEHVNVPDGSKFRGWFEGPNATDLKVADGTVLTEDIELYARVTEIEDLIKNPQYEYDLTKKYFYLEDHELLTIENGKYHNDHGWTFDEGSNVSVEVPGNVRLTLTLCQYSAEGNVQITDASGNKIGKPFNAKADKDKDEVVIDYVGGPTTLSFSMPKGSYLHKLVVKNTQYPSVVFVNRYPKTLLGKVPADIIAAPGTHKVRIPENTTLYREGWSMIRWEDEDKHPFNFNEEYVVDVATTLYPVIEKSVSLTETNSVLNVTWPFDLLDGAPKICLHNKNEDANVMTYTKQTTVEGTKVDVPLIIDASNGKVDNTDTRVNALDDGAGHEAHGGQLNDGTILTVPAVYGMTVTLNASNKIDTDSRYNNNKTLFGDAATDAVIELYDAKGKLAIAPTITNNGKSISFTYTGDATSLDLLLKKTGSSTTWGFFKDITVSYPVLPDVVGENVITTTPKLSDKELDKNAGVVILAVKTSTGSHGNTGKRYKVGDEVTLTAEPNYGYEVSGFRLKGGAAIEGVTDRGEGAKSIDYTVTAGITTIEVLYTRKEMVKVTAKAAKGDDDKVLGEVTLSPKYDNFYTTLADGAESYYVAGTDVVASSEGISEYVIDKWTNGVSEDALSNGNGNTYAFTVSEARTVVAHFKRGEIGSVIFDISVTTPNDKNVDGYDAPATNYNNSRSIKPDNLTNVRSFTIPTNFTFFKNNGESDGFGYTLKYWTDASGNRYELGKVYSFATENQTITLTPHFEKNPATQLNRLNNPIIHYEFGTGAKTYTDKTESFINPGTIVGDKKVAAQKVNIGNNQKFFWTSQVYTEVLDNGHQLPHTRDVAMWVATGSKGFFRNGDLDEWASFGPGTTFWFASGAGTKVSIMTYAPITTTTIDGIVPELDEEDPRCDVKNHKYVYSLVVDNPTLRIPIVIGDDYSYYQWFETATLAANMVNLHADVDDDVRGAVTAIGTESAYGASELEDGGYAFHQGDRVKLKFERLFGFEFDKIIDPDRDNLAVLEMLPDNKVKMVKGSTGLEFVELSQNVDGSWGTFIEDDSETVEDESADNTVFTLKMKEPTDDEKAEGKRTRYEVEFNISTHRNLIFCFKEKPTYYITFNAGQLASGSAPAAVWVEEGDKYMIPYNNTLYYEGNTLDYWYDESDKSDKHYTIGSTDNVAPGNDLRLFPHFSPNAFSLLDADGKATWELTTKAGAPTIAFERSRGILVTQLYDKEDDSKWIDLKIDLDASDHIGADGKPEMKDGKVIAGKFNNTASDDRCQINQYSVITFPTSTGCVIKMNVSSGNIGTTTVAGLNNGDTGYTSTNNSFSVTYSGADATQKAEFNESNIYATDFSVIYTPQSADKPSLASLSVGGVALTSDQLDDLKTNHTLTVTVEPYTNNDTIPAITGTATNGGVVKATEATVEMENPQSTVTVWTKEKDGFLLETYTINFNYGTPTDAPKFVKYIVNGVEKTTSTAIYDDVPVSGIVQVVFDRTMQSTTIPSASQSLTKDTHSAERGKVLEFRYWNLPAGGSTTLTIPESLGLFKDIYGVNLAQDLKLTLNVQAASDIYEHRTFDYIVGKDGDIDNAITQANAATGTDRYYVFIPDGEYKLTGNEKITPTMSSDGMAPADNDGVNRNDLLGKAIDNGKTQITRANVSLIGQSREGVTVYNKPTIEGISYTSTIHTTGTATDFYVEDMTLEDRFDYKTSIANQEKSPAARGVVFQDGANRSIMKNVALKSWQDTYWSSGSDGDYRGYFEGCQLWGVVDWICGNGDIWFEKCDMVIRDRSGNNLAAPRTSRQQQWGYVLNQCNIIKEPDVTISELADKSWTLARPWGSGATNSPACTFLSNKIEIQPRQSGWGTMGSEMILRFHEYNTTDLNGNPVSLGTRSLAACSPAAGSDDCVLNEKQASNYTVRNALGGADAFDPQTLTKQIDAKSGGVTDMNTYAWQDDIEIDDDFLQWKNETMALCYFIFKKNGDKWEYIANVAQKEGEEYTSFNLYEYGGGLYCVRAANQRGGLGAATKEVNYVPSTAITLELKELKEGTPQYEQYRGRGWSTICLPFNSKVPEGLTVYAANGKKDFSEKEVADNYQLYLKSVDVLNGTDADGKNYGYVVYGPVGTYEFRSSSKTSDVITILSGNPTSESIDRGNNNCYVMSNKTTYGLGFYKYTGATLAANRAWLPINMVDMNSQTDASKAITFFIVNDDDVTTAITDVDRVGDEVIYNLHGQRIQRSQMRRGGVYIINGVKRMYRGK